MNHYTTTKAEVEKAESLGVSVGIYHKKKNDTAKSKEKLKSPKKDFKKSITSHPSTSSTLPPGQEKKQEEGNSMELNNNLNTQVQVQNEYNKHQINNGDNRNKENGMGKENQPVKESTIKNNNKPNNTWAILSHKAKIDQKIMKPIHKRKIRSNESKKMNLNIKIKKINLNRKINQTIKKNNGINKSGKYAGLFPCY